VRAQGYYVIDREPTREERSKYPLIATVKLRPGVYAAARMPMSNTFARAIVTAAAPAATRPLLETPTAGGSLPLSIINDSLGTPAMVISIANHDDNQHAANENLRLGNLWDGIDLFAALLLHQ
jgi:acetylornithine deacetylase/succinyl-diaminopimelate desuccinylase-like protein